MSIPVTCKSCGQFYSLKDEFAGRLLKCKQCEAQIRVPHLAEQVATSGDPIFNRDKFLLRQKHFSISEKYYVWDEAGQTILFVERPAHFLRNLGAGLAGILAGILAVVIFVMIGSVFGADSSIAAIFFLLSIPAFIVALMLVYLYLCKKRHVYFYRNDTKEDKVLEVLQDEKFQFFKATYTIVDEQGNLLGKLCKNYFYDLFRKRWVFYDNHGSRLCLIQEDSIMLALLRRLLGTFYGLLRTNFVICVGKNERIIGEFNRKFTLLDRYVLDMSSDPERLIDRRIAVAIGVMLDTGERR